MVVSGQHPSKDFPDLSECYDRRNRKKALKIMRQWNKSGECCKTTPANCPCQTIYGDRREARLINVQFGDDGRHISPEAGTDRYDLNDDTDVIVHSDSGITFDFILWSDTLGKWIDANHCQPGMVVKQSDTSDIDYQYENTEGFNRSFFCVICEGGAK